MSEFVDEGKTEYPGNVRRWKSLRERADQDPENVGLEIACQLAGLQYIADGIRFSLRPKDAS